MSDITITAMEPGHFGVQVTEGNLTTSHRVRVPVGMLQDLGVPGEQVEMVVRESFKFLLEREPASSILSEFSLDSISTHFPEYTEELRLRLGP